MSDGPQDAELSAMSRCVRALEPLDRDQRARVMKYLNERYDSVIDVLHLISDEMDKKMMEMDDKVRAEKKREAGQ